MSNVQFEPGQIWNYQTRATEPNSTLQITQVEDDLRLGRIVHVAVHGVRMPSRYAPTGYAETIGHLPFAEEAVRNSVTTQAGYAPVPDDNSGYEQWKRAFDAGKAGVFTISVAESVDAVESILQQGMSPQ